MNNNSKCIILKDPPLKLKEKIIVLIDFMISVVVMFLLYGVFMIKVKKLLLIWANQDHVE